MYYKKSIYLLLILYITIYACRSTQLVPTETSISTVDQVATGVAEAKAVAATLTAEALIVTSIPLIIETTTSTIIPTMASIPPSLEPTFTSIPSSTSLPTPTSIPNTSPGTILDAGKTWYQDGVEVVLKDPGPWADSVPQYTSPEHRSGMVFKLFLTNRKPQDISIAYSGDMNFSAVDNLGRQLEISDVWSGVVPSSCGQQTRIVRVGQTMNLGCREYSNILVFVDIGNTAITEIIFTLSGISSISDAKWRIIIYH